MTREKSVIFTGRLSYEIFMKHYEVKKKKKSVKTYTDIHDKIYNMHLQNKYILGWL